MAGGPGANAIAPAGILVSVGLNQNRDLIIMNQRGVAYTEPNLACPEIDRFKEAVGLRYDSPDTASCTWPRRKPAMIAELAKGST